MHKIKRLLIIPILVGVLFGGVGCHCNNIPVNDNCGTGFTHYIPNFWGLRWLNGGTPA